jgi:hypothetical protein
LFYSRHAAHFAAKGSIMELPWNYSVVLIVCTICKNTLRPGSSVG